MSGNNSVWTRSAMLWHNRQGIPREIKKSTRVLAGHGVEN